MRRRVVTNVLLGVAAVLSVVFIFFVLAVLGIIDTDAITMPFRRSGDDTGGVVTQMPDNTPESTLAENTPQLTTPPPTTRASGSGMLPEDEDEGAVSEDENELTHPEGILLIGDSVTMGAEKNLLGTIDGITTDCEGSRQMRAGYRLIMSMQDEGTLPETVIVALGTNTNKNTEEYVDKIIDEIDPGHRLIFVVPYIAGYGEGSGAYRTAVYLQGLAGVFDFVTIADWATAAQESGIRIGSDGIHIGGNRPAIELMTQVIVDAIDEARGKPVK